MNELLTREEYKSIAGSLSFASNAYINGKFVSAKSGERFPTFNPATGDKITEIACCGPAECDYAVKKARSVFESGTWSRLHPSDRKSRIIKLVKLMRRNRHELAVLESVESGKPIRDVATIDVPETIDCYAWYAEAADKLYDQVSPANDDAMGLIIREPVGVVACIVPWNFPMQMMAWKVAPALAAGNSVIVKPAEETSMSALRIAELAGEAGIPAGVLNVLPGPGELTGAALAEHPGIDALSFTGSTEAGRLVLGASARTNLKRTVLELGGKNPAVVLEDAEELDHVAAEVIRAVFWNMGENCSSNSRLIVHQKHKADLLERMVAALREWPTGDPLDPKNALGALVSESHYDKVKSYIDGALAEGATRVCGGESMSESAGLFLSPTILDDVRLDMPVVREEIFGPVLSVLTVNSDAEAIALANDTEYGLQASVFCAHGKKALRAARAIKAGTVTINCYGEGDLTTPFGGYKLSGFGGRDNGLHAFDQYTETKTIWIDLSDHDLEEQIE